MDVIATIDAESGDDSFELKIENSDEAVKIWMPPMKPAVIYINREDLIQALCALDVGS